jgi:hypothetical protein
MKKILPLTYKQTGVKPYKRNYTHEVCRANVEFNIREVETHTINPAVSFIDRKSEARTTFFFHDDSFWMQDGLKPSTPYSRQLMFLCGFTPLAQEKKRPFGTRRPSLHTDAGIASYNEKRMNSIRHIGLALMRSPSDDGNRFLGASSEPSHGTTHIVVDGEVRAIEETHDSAFRSPPVSSFKERFQAMNDWLDENVISCNGTLYVRVPKPILVGADKIVDWHFEGLVPSRDADGYDSWGASAYQTEVIEFDNLMTSVGAEQANFDLDFIDESLFEEPDYVEAVLTDFAKGLRNHLFSMEKLSDAYLLKWIELRSLARSNNQWGEYGYLKPTERPDDNFIENVALTLTELGSLGGDSYSGAELWLSRKVLFPKNQLTASHSSSAYEK